MNLSLGKLKIVKALSEETTCFTADLLLDGRVIAHLSNRGHGGCDEVRAVDRDALKAAEEWCKTLPPLPGFQGCAPLPMDLELYVSGLIDKHEIEGRAKRALKNNILFIRDGELYQVSRKRSTLSSVRRTQEHKHPGKTIVYLDDMGPDAALAKVIELAQVA